VWHVRWKVATDIPSLIRQTDEERNQMIALVQHLSDEQDQYKLPRKSGPSMKIRSTSSSPKSPAPAKSGPQPQAFEKANPSGPANTPTADNPSKKSSLAPGNRKKRTAHRHAPHRRTPYPTWLGYLQLAQALLDKIEPVLTGLDPEAVLFPRFLCGPLDAAQRVDFLRFHINRHRGQILALMAEPGFPAD